MSASESARSRARAELTAEILAAAGDELAEVGAAALSLRAVARRLGLVPSALYRYYESRDALLTALIIEAYEELGAVGEAAGGKGATTLEQWLSVATAVRGWSAENPHRWALIYGSPVPGYAAPEDTVGAAMKIVEVMSAIVRRAPSKPVKSFEPVPALESVLKPVTEAFFPDSPPQVAAAGIAAWTALVGAVSLERFGHFKGATTDHDAMFRYLMVSAGRSAGLR